MSLLLTFFINISYLADSSFAKIFQKIFILQFYVVIIVGGANHREIALITLCCYGKQSNVDIMIRLWSPIDAFRNFVSLKRQ